MACFCSIKLWVWNHLNLLNHVGHLMLAVGWGLEFLRVGYFRLPCDMVSGIQGRAFQEGVRELSRSHIAFCDLTLNAVVTYDALCYIS